MPIDTRSATIRNGIFVTGTDTNAGKTFVSAILVRGWKGSYWKPIQAGIEEGPIGTDTGWVRTYTQLDADHFLPESYLLRTPMSPHAAARLDRVKIELEKIVIPKALSHEPLVVEGAGGIMVPLNEEALILNLIERLRLSVLVVASSRLGTINHTCLTINALRQQGASVLGVVMNGPPSPVNARAIEQCACVPVLASVPTVSEITTDALDALYAQHFQRPFWNNLFGSGSSPSVSVSSHSVPSSSPSLSGTATAPHVVRGQDVHLFLEDGTPATPQEVLQ